jgi:hypothetical protein
MVINGISKLPFIPVYNDVYFATKLLFGNKYKVCLIINQSKVETGDFKNYSYNECNNAFCLGVKNDGSLRFPAIGTKQSDNPKAPIFNVYRMKEDSVYSLYYMYYHDVKEIGYMVEQIPQGNTTYAGYVGRFVEELARVYWFGRNGSFDDYKNYAIAIYNSSKEFKFSNYMHYGSYLLTVYFWWWAYKFFRYLFAVLGFIKSEVKGTAKGLLQRKSIKGRQKIYNTFD